MCNFVPTVVGMGIDLGEIIHGLDLHGQGGITT